MNCAVVPIGGAVQPKASRLGGSDGSAVPIGAG